MTMTLAVSATQVTGWRARVSLTVTAPTPGATITLYRDDLSGVLVPVLGASSLLPASTVVDDTPGLNRPTWYRAVASGAWTRVNLCTNQGGDVDTSGWFPQGGAVLTRDTVAPIVGAASFKLTGGGDAYARATVAAGDTVTFSLDYTTVGTVTGTPRLYLGVPGAGLTQALPLTQSAPGRYSVTATATGPGLAVCDVIAPNSPGVIHFDNVLIEVNAPDTVYFWAPKPYVLALSAITPAPLTVASTLPVLSDPRGGRAVQLTIAEWNEVEIESSSTSVQIDVEDPADDAVVWLIGSDGARRASITLRTDDGPTLTEARAILRAGRALLLRGSAAGVEDPWLVVTGRRERRVTNNVSDWRRYLVLSAGLPLSAPDPTVPVLGDTLQDLADAYATLAAIDTAYATLGAIAQADLKAL